MRKVHLVRHGEPRIDAETPSHAWVLSERGKAQARQAAERLRHERPRLVITSEEPKAIETGRALAQVLGLSARSHPGLHEHRRQTMPFFREQAEFEAQVLALFARPAERVLGEESADEAHARFAAALGRVLDETQGDLVVVAHGTVISLLVARANGLDAAQVWRSFELGAHLTVRWPGAMLA